MRASLLVLFMATTIFSACTLAASPDPARLKELAKSYVAAQFSFDQDAIGKLTAPKFVEISPKGEIDERATVLAFYAPDKKRPAPPYDISHSNVRISGSTAVITQVVSVGKAPRSLKLVQALTATRVGSQWLLTSSQSTPLHISPRGE